VNRQTKDALLAAVILSSHQSVHDRIVDLPEYDAILSVATSMITSLLHDLGHLGPEVLSDQSWVAGFVSGVATAGMLTTIEDVVHSETDCPDGLDHRHRLLHADQLIAYLDTAAYGVIEGHQLFQSLEELTADEQQ
jgi:hypothetical protein